MIFQWVPQRLRTFLEVFPKKDIAAGLGIGLVSPGLEALIGFPVAWGVLRGVVRGHGAKYKDPARQLRLMKDMSRFGLKSPSVQKELQEQQAETGAVVFESMFRTGAVAAPVFLLKSLVT